MNTIDFVVRVPESIIVRGEGKDATRVDMRKVAALPEAERIAAMSESWLGGFLVTMTNTYNSGGKETSVADKLANLRRRLDAFESGVWVSRGGGNRDSMEGLMRDAFYNEKGANDSASRAKIDSAIKATVKRVFGDKESARFYTFLDAVATELGRKRAGKGEDEKAVIADLREKLGAKYEALAEKLKADRAKELDVIDIDDLI